MIDSDVEIRGSGSSVNWGVVKKYLASHYFYSNVQKASKLSVAGALHQTQLGNLPAHG